MSWLNELRGQLFRLAGTFQYAFEGRRLIVARDHEQCRLGIVRDRSGQGHTFSVQLAHPIAHDQPGALVQRPGTWKQRKRMAVIAHAQKNKVEARKLTRSQTESQAQLGFVLE